MKGEKKLGFLLKQGDVLDAKTYLNLYSLNKNQKHLSRVVHVGS
jgi:hypothetical protein